MNERSHSLSAPSGAAAETGECHVRATDAEALSRASAALAPEERARRTVEIFSALADPTRFRILDALSAEELCVCDLATIARVSQSAVSHQLRLLRERGLVAFTRDGNRAVYRLSDSHVRTLIAQGLAHAAEGESEPGRAFARSAPGSSGCDR